MASVSRLDISLVARGLFESRAKAQAAIASGGVRVNGRLVKKASLKVSDIDDISAKAAHSWVSRGGLKLVKALDEFGVDVRGFTALDLGASTGGFTDVLLSRGANKVYAVDVGTEQLHPKLKSDSRVISLEQTDARELTKVDIPDAIQIIVCDASFISAMKVLERPMSLTRTGTHLICLVKPQFEVGQEGLSRGGIVRDGSLAADTLTMVKTWVSEQGWKIKGSCDSPIQGGSGNREFLLHAVKR